MTILPPQGSTLTPSTWRPGVDVFVSSHLDGHTVVKVLMVTGHGNPPPSDPCCSSSMPRHCFEQTDRTFWSKPVNPYKGIRLLKAAQHLWLVLHDDVYQRFTYVNHTAQSELSTALVLAVATPYCTVRHCPVRTVQDAVRPLSILLPSHRMRDTFVPRASHPASVPGGTVFLTTHASVGYRWRTTGSSPAISP
jgi:hypothetical protein